MSSMIKPKFAFFQVQVKGAGTHATEANQPGFGISPKTFYTVDVGFASGKEVLSMIDAKMFTIANIDQAIITSPSVRVDDAVKTDFAPYNRLQRGFRAIRYDLGIDLTVALEKTKDNCFA